MMSHHTNRTRLPHPPFQPVADATGGDFCSKEGAAKLALRIEDAWAKAGHKIRATVVERRLKEGVIYGVDVPDLVNGLPVRADATRAA